jgi:predicted transcriptional regulator
LCFCKRVQHAIFLAREVAMTKLELAVKEARKLSPEEQERLGDNVLHYIHKYLALRDDLEAGLRDLDAGRMVDGKEVFARLKATHGA